MENLNSENIIFLDKEDDLKSVLACFKVNQISHVPVISDKKIVAMISKTDVVEYLYDHLADHMGENFETLLQKVRVKELMVQPLVEAKAEDSQLKILEQMINHQVSSVILKKDKKMVGIVTEKDMLRYLAGELEKNMSFSEKLGLHVVDWLNRNGIIKVSQMLADIGI